MWIVRDWKIYEKKFRLNKIDWFSAKCYFIIISIIIIKLILCSLKLD